MEPMHDELIKLNPLLSKKSKEELDELIKTITDLGYHWDEFRKCFWNKEIEISVRTQGLDLFDSERFKKVHKTWSSPDYISGAKLGKTWIPKIFLVLLLDVLLGWIFIPIKIWIISLVFLVAPILIIRKVAHKKLHKSSST